MSNVEDIFCICHVLRSGFVSSCYFSPYWVNEPLKISATKCWSRPRHLKVNKCSFYWCEKWHIFICFLCTIVIFEIRAFVCFCGHIKLSIKLIIELPEAHLMLLINILFLFHLGKYNLQVGYSPNDLWFWPRYRNINNSLSSCLFCKRLLGIGGIIQCYAWFQKR